MTNNHESGMFETTFGVDGEIETFTNEKPVSTMIIDSDLMYVLCFAAPTPTKYMYLHMYLHSGCHSQGFHGYLHGSTISKPPPQAYLLVMTLIIYYYKL